MSLTGFRKITQAKIKLIAIVQVLIETTGPYQA